MNSYIVTWTINIEADTPKEAAEKALTIQRDPSSIATCFDVELESELFFIDLEQDNQE